MTLPRDWQFAVEVHPPDWRFPAGASWLAGWIFAGEHRFVSDLRAWVDGQPFLGLHGLPKPGLDERFLGRPGPPYSGFVLQVTPHRGATLLRLEARGPSGRWLEFFRQAISVDMSAAPAAAAASMDSRLPELTIALLRLHSQRSGIAWPAVADEVVSAALALPLNTLPVPPFHGALEEPRDRGWLRYGRLSVTGWLAHRTAKIRRVSALVDAVQESTLLHGLPRADIGDVFSDLPGRAESAFVGHVDLPANQAAPALLKVFAELEGGEKHLVFAQRFVPKVIAGAEASLPPRSRLIFARAAWAVRNSLRRHGLPAMPLAAQASATRAAWQAYDLQAPARSRSSRVERLDATTVEPAAATAPLRILAVTHNLNFEGAPWFLFELVRHLRQQPGTTVHLLSPQDGPMRPVFAEAGITVQVVDVAPALAAAGAEDFHRALAAAVAPDWSALDVVIANTMVSFWAVHLARAAGKPSLLYVHESSPVERFFAPLVAPALFPVIAAAFRQATRVVFTADASRQVFDALGDRGNFCLLPSWVGVAAIDAFAAQHDPAVLRRKHGLDPAATLLVNIGSICERKGQHIYLRAAELLRDELRFTYPGRRIQWVMVGARPGVYLDTLVREATMHQLDNVVFLPETREIHDFYRLADVFVCTSFEESFPRVLLESAAYRLPIVSTNVNGIAEMLAPDEAWLTPPGDRYQLAEAVKAALAAHFAGDRRRATKARASVERTYGEAHSLPRHAALVRSVVARS